MDTLQCTLLCLGIASIYIYIATIPKVVEVRRRSKYNGDQKYALPRYFPAAWVFLNTCQVRGVAEVKRLLHKYPSQYLPTEAPEQVHMHNNDDLIMLWGV